MIWLEKRWILIGMALLLAVNAVFFLTYRVRYEERVRELDERLSEARLQLDEANRERIAAEKRLVSYEQTSKDVETIYEEWWATPKERLAPLIVELRELAERSALIPAGRIYTTGESGNKQRREIEASTMTISFSVQGTYERIRQLINMIELSDHFIIIEQIALSDVSQPGQEALTLNLRLVTLFARADEVDTSSGT